MPTAAPGQISRTTGKRVAVGLLTWKSDVTLEASLADHQAKGIFDLFDDVVIHFQEVRDSDIARAGRYGLRWLGSERNRHIGGGFNHLVQNVEADYLFLLEDDLTFAVSAEQLRATLVDAVTLMEAGKMDQFLCRRDDMVRSGYEKFFPLTQFDRQHNPPGLALRTGGSALGRGWRRLLHPHQAEKHLGKIVWFEQHPEQVRPDVVTRMAGASTDFYVVQGRATKWANPAVFARRAHFIEVYDHIRSQVPGFDAFGRSLEGLINDGPFRPWWLAQQYRIGLTKPVMTYHARQTDGGKLGFVQPSSPAQG